MKILILTNEKYINFILQKSSKYVAGNEIWVKCFGEYDWSEHDYDIGISFMYQYKVPKEQLNKPWFNFHPAPLPEYKGRNLCYHAIINREKEFGATLHYMDENFDTGKIIIASKFPILPHYTADVVSEISIEFSKMLFESYFPRIISGETFPTFKNGSGYYYYKKPIDDFIDIPENEKIRIRAITYGKFYPKVNIGRVIYKIVRDE